IPRPSIQEALFSFKAQISSLQEWLLEVELPWLLPVSVQRRAKNRVKGSKSVTKKGKTSE
ncbi:hypothetical protein, partial [Brevibacillus agri]